MHHADGNRAGQRGNDSHFRTSRMENELGGQETAKAEKEKALKRGQKLRGSSGIDKT